MTAEELISHGSHKVRRDKELMRRYIEIFTAVFSKAPDCAGCTFNRDWNKLVRSVRGGQKIPKFGSTSKQNTMDYKLQNKYRSTILTYIKGGKPVRTYGRNMTDGFAAEYLKNGSKEQLATRRKMFESIPAPTTGKVQTTTTGKATTPKKEKGPKPLSRMNRTELDAYAKLKGLDPAKYANRKEIIKALK